MKIADFLLEVQKYKCIDNIFNTVPSDIITGSKPAVKMALKQDFWSTRDHITYFEPGRCLFKAMRHKATPMPVATGATKASLADLE